MSDRKFPSAEDATKRRVTGHYPYDFANDAIEEFDFAVDYTSHSGGGTMYIALTDDQGHMQGRLSDFALKYNYRFKKMVYNTKHDMPDDAVVEAAFKPITDKV